MAAQAAIAAPYSSLFERVPTRPVSRGVVPSTVDVETLAEVFPAVAYHRVAALGKLVVESDVLRVIDGALLPALAQPGGSAAPATRRRSSARASSKP